MLQFGFAREVITPVRGVPLCGYFNPRPNTGAYDDLSVKAAIIECNGTYAGMVTFDLCFVGLELLNEIQSALRAAGITFVDHIMFSATHTHTGPYTQRFFGADPDPLFLDGLVKKTVSAIQRATKSLAPAELLASKTHCANLAFNRRYFMKDGNVLTNPGKLNPLIDKPEGPIDPEIPMIAFKQDGLIRLIVANIVNHTDTIGEDFVSADWPGRMEHELQRHFGYDLPVMTLIGCSGNINHFDTTAEKNQTSYAEAVRIGKTYAAVISSALYQLRTIPVQSIQVDTSTLKVPFSTISQEAAEAAKATLARVGNASTDEDMTSEGLASGDGPVARFFAEQLLAFKDTCSGKTRDFSLVSIKIGNDIGLVSLPGEPFTEIGLGIKDASRFPMTMVVALAMGAAGYVPMPDCFARGGYEILPVEGGGPDHELAPKMIKAASELINK